MGYRTEFQQRRLANTKRLKRARQRLSVSLLRRDVLIANDGTQRLHILLNAVL